MGTAAFTIGALGNNTPVFTIAALTGQIFSNAVTIIQNNTNASNVSTGSLQTAGGAGIARNLYVGGNISVTGTSNLGANANVKITGGTSGQALTTDGSGNLSWTGVITTITPNALSSTVHVAAVTTGNTANIISDATTANTANTIVVRDQYGAINVNSWAVNTKLTATNYTATALDYWIGLTAKNLTITLPNAANGAYNGRQYEIGDAVHSGNPGDTITTQSPAIIQGNDNLSQQGQYVLATYIDGVWYCN